MDTKQAQLYAKILAFEFDEVGTCRTFAARLAEENDWSAEFVDRAIFEYRRFLFLTVAAGHVVCPSEEVDEVWHLHLIYSRSYWERLCGEVLERPLHHDPSRGGREQYQKHRRMYADTLDSYRRLFGEEPPADLWPDVAKRFAPPRQQADRARYWLIPKPAAWFSIRSSWRRLGTGAVFTSMAVVPLVSVAIDHPFNMHGPEFLAFYASLLLIAFGAASTVRMLAKSSSGTETGEATTSLDVYQAAYLGGGADWAVKTALARLLADSEIIVVRTTPLRVGRSGTATTTRHALERALLMAMPAAPEGTSQDGLKMQSQGVLASLGESLQARGLLMSPQRASIARVAPLAIMAAAIFVGLIKIVVGLERHRPVGFLCLMCVLATVVTLLAFTRRVVRTHAGDRQLLSMKVGNQHLRKQAREMQFPAHDSLSLAVALFGLGVLIGGPHQNLTRSLDPTARIDCPPQGKRNGGSSYGGIGAGCGGGAHLGGGHGCGGGGGAGCGGGGGGGGRGGGGCGGGGCGGCGG